MANCKKTDMFIGAIKSSAAKPVKKAVGGDMAARKAMLDKRSADRDAAMAARKATIDKRYAQDAVDRAARTAAINKRVFDRTGKTPEDLAAEKAAAAAKVKQKIAARDPNAPTAMQRVEKLYMNAPRAYNPDEDQARRTRMDNYKQHYTDSIAKLEGMRAAKNSGTNGMISRPSNPDYDPEYTARVDKINANRSAALAKIASMAAAKGGQNAMTPTKKAAGGAGKTRKGMMK